MPLEKQDKNNLSCFATLNLKFTTMTTAGLTLLANIKAGAFIEEWKFTVAALALSAAFCLDMYIHLLREDVVAYRRLKRSFRDAPPLAKKILREILERDAVLFELTKFKREGDADDEYTGYFYVQAPGVGNAFERAEPGDTEKQKEIVAALDYLCENYFITPSHSIRNIRLTIKYELEYQYIRQNKALAQRYIIKQAPLYRPRYRER